MVHTTTPTAGVDFDLRTTAQGFDLMTTVNGSDGYAYHYVQANGAIAASQTDVALVLATGQASDGAGTYVSTTAFADNEYGWIRSPNALGV